MNPFAVFQIYQNLELDFRSSSGPWVNFDWTSVRFTLGSEPDHGITSHLNIVICTG